MRKLMYLLPIVLLLCSGFTCHQSARISHGVAVSINDLQAAEISLHGLGQISDDEHRSLEQGFKTLAQADLSVRRCIASSGAPGCVDGAIDAVNALSSSTIIGVKNPDSKKQLQLLAQALIASLNTLRAAL